MMLRHACVGLVLSLFVPLLAIGQATTRPVAKDLAGLPVGTEAARDVNYADTKVLSQTLDLVVPPNPTGKPLPLLVYVHGGGWQLGDKRPNPMLGLVNMGYAVASINYRLSQEAVFPAQIYDCKAAIRWLRAHADQYHLDKERIGVGGDSAGGHLVALLGTSGDVKELEGDVGKYRDQPTHVACVVDVYGPTDLSVFWQQAEKAKNVFVANKAGSPIDQLFGGPVEEKTDLVKLANPITFVTKKTPPFLIVHGDHDPLVPLAQSEILKDALERAGVPVHLEVIKGGGHGGAEFVQPGVVAMMVGFLQEHLQAAAK